MKKGGRRHSREFENSDPELVAFGTQDCPAEVQLFVRPEWPIMRRFDDAAVEAKAKRHRDKTDPFPDIVRLLTDLPADHANWSPLADAQNALTEFQQQNNENCADGTEPFRWIRFDNSQRSRQNRLLHSSATCNTILNKGYFYKSKEVVLDVEESLAQVRLTEPGNNAARKKNRPAIRPNVQRSSLCPIEAALEFCEKGYAGTVVSAASAYHCGGGFTSGGRHALEEAICIQTSLFFSLWKMWVKSKKDIHIPRGGAIVSPHVQVFRGPTAEGYPFLPKATTIQVVSIAMPNFNPSVRDAPLEDVRGEEYAALVEENFRRVLEAAEIWGGPSKRKVCVIPDAGCGVYQNDPDIVGNILNGIIGQYGLDQIILTGSEDFADAVMEGMGGPEDEKE